MIKLERPPKPVQLTDEIQAVLTERYKNTGRVVWNQLYVREALLASSHQKCCYCEKRIGSGFPDMHIDHYLPKSLYEEFVIDWNNLMPCCGDCNRSKSNHDTGNLPLVNPFVNEPKEFFFLKDFFYKAIDNRCGSMANITISVLELNDLDKKCKLRYLVVTKIMEDLKETLNLAQRNQNSLTVDIALSNDINRRLRGVLRMCIPEAEYSAFVATAVIRDPDYSDLKNILIAAGRWTDELQQLEQSAMLCVYRTTR